MTVPPYMHEAADVQRLIDESLATGEPVEVDFDVFDATYFARASETLTAVGKRTRLSGQRSQWTGRVPDGSTWTVIAHSSEF